MEHQIIKIIFQHPEYDKESIVKYEFESTTKNLIVSVEGHESAEFYALDQCDLDDVRKDIAGILPDWINELGAPISLIENFIFNGFLKRMFYVNKINHSVVIITYKPEFKIKMILSCGKIITFPMTKSDYFRLNLEDLF